MGQPLDSPSHQLPLGLSSLPAPSRADGVVGRNAAALEALDSALRGHPAAQTPVSPRAVYLWGPPGCGKTFWLSAFAREHPEVRRLLRCGQPMSRDSPARALEAQASDAPLVWLIDDVHLANPDEQACLFTLYNQAMQHNAPIVFAADRPPRHMKSREDLRTRLGQCLVFELAELSEPEMRDALRERALVLGWLSHAEQDSFDRLFDYLLSRLPRNLSLLTELLQIVDRRALSLKRPISLPLVRSLIDETLASQTKP